MALPGGGRRDVHPGLRRLHRSAARKLLPAQICTFASISDIPTNLELFTQVELLWWFQWPRLRVERGVDVSPQFSVFLGIIFFLELTAGVLAFVFKDWIKDQLNFFINNNIRAYRDDIDLQNLIDFTQEYVSMCFLMSAVPIRPGVDFTWGQSRLCFPPVPALTLKWECCGAFGADDWNLNIYFNCTDSNPSREKCGVPFSCCTKDPAVCLNTNSLWPLFPPVLGLNAEILHFFASKLWNQV